MLLLFWKADGPAPTPERTGGYWYAAPEQFASDREKAEEARRRLFEERGQDRNALALLLRRQMGLEPDELPDTLDEMFALLQEEEDVMLLLLAH